MSRTSLRPLTVLLAAALPLFACSDDGSSTPQPDKDSGPPPVKPISYDEVVDACARVAACGIERARLADCVDDYYRRFVRFGQEGLWSSIYRCVNEGNGDCGAVRVCLGYKRKPNQCNKDDYTPRCENGVAYNCDLLARWEQAIDCKLGNLQCGVKEAGTGKQAVCGGGPCDPTKFRGECRNKRYFQCSSGAIEIDDCVSQQLQCRDGKVGCEGTDETCLPTGSQCDEKNNTLLDCVEGYVMRRDCSKVFGKKTCVTGENECRGDGKECSATDFDKCVGDVLEICIDGYKRSLDCKKMGFIGCQPTTYGANCKAEPVYD